MPIRPYLTLVPLTSAGRSAAAYVPLVLASRGLAFMRLLVVAKLLGDAGQPQYGLYRPALEFINPLVALVLFGSSDVVERYASEVRRTRGPAGLAAFVARGQRRVAGTGLVCMAALAPLGGMISDSLWGVRSFTLTGAALLAVLTVALFQHVAATLRGLRATAAAAGMEFSAAICLLVFSALAAVYRDAALLLLAYALSVMLPTAYYGLALRRHLRSEAAGAPAAEVTPGGRLPAQGATEGPAPRGFATASVVRMMLVMGFGFLAMLGMRQLAEQPHGDEIDPHDLGAIANFAMVFSIAQLLAYLAVTLWASAYGIAATAWSHGQRRRARVLMFRTGRFGLAALLVLSAGMVLARPAVAMVLPPVYAPAIERLLPPMLAVFTWYAMVAFAGTYADLSERPQRGARLWSVIVMAVLLGAPAIGFFEGRDDPAMNMTRLLAASVGLPLLGLAPWLVFRPFRITRLGLPLMLMGVATGSLLVPTAWVNLVAVPVLVGTVALLLGTGLLVRPLDRRSFRAFLKRR